MKKPLGNQALLEEHLYGFADAASFAALLRISGEARVAARKCLELAVDCADTHDGGPVEVEPLTILLETGYQRVPDEWLLAKLRETPVGEVVIHFGYTYNVEADADGSRHLRHHGLRLVGVTGETLVARRKT